MTSMVRGRLVFRQAGPAVPLHHLTIDVRCGSGLHRGPWVRATTDLDGCFSLAIDGHGQATLRVIDLAYHYTADGSPDLREVVAREQAIELTGGELGDIPVAFWPYRDDTPVPRAAAVDGRLPQAYTKGFMHTLEASFARSLPTKALLEGMRLFDGHPTVAEIQAHEPEVRSVRADKEKPGTSRSDAWIGDMLLNGFHIALSLGRNAEDPEQLRARITWGEMPARTDGAGYDLADVDVVLALQDDDVVPVRINLRLRTPGSDGSWASDREVCAMPGDPNWEAAKRVVRCQYLLQGAIDGHITTGHFQTEAAAIATFRNLRESPLRGLLHAHLQEIVPQGHDGDSFAWGPKGILMSQSALTLDAVNARMREVVARSCWQTFAPPPVLHPTHRYAKAANRFWDLLGGYLEAFFEANAAQIAATWPEVRRFSDDLVRSSPPVDLATADPAVLPLREAGPVKRVCIDGVTRSVPPVTQTDTPASGEVAALRQLCQVILFRATFDHTWTHDGQYDAGGELALATFGLRNGSLGPESDVSLLPPTATLIEAISVNTIGIHANYGMLLADEERDVAPDLKARLHADADAFAALGVDVTRIRSRINI